MESQLITVEDQTSPGTLTPEELRSLVQALELQASRDYNTSPWVERGYAPPAHVALLPKGEPLPKGAWNIILLDDTTQQGALGFHEDGEGDVPFSEVFVKTCREDGTPLSECASHEMAEMLVDPYVVGRAPRQVTHEGKDWIVEVADPVESCGYDAGNGQIVADFCWPRWFGMPQTRLAYSQRHSISASFTLAPEGYISTRPAGGSEESWTQTFGERRSELPKWASRLPRIHGSAAMSSSSEESRGHVSDRQVHEIWKAIRRLERQQMATQQEVDQITSEVQTVAGDITSVSQTLQSEIDNLAAANPSIDLSGLRSAVQPLAAAVESLGNLQPLKPEASPSPTGEGAGAGGEGAGSGSSPGAEPTKSVYTHSGEGAIDADWTTSGFETAPAEGEQPQPLYYFSGDTNPGETNGAGGEWEPYTGAVQQSASAA